MGLFAKAMKKFMKPKGKGKGKGMGKGKGKGKGFGKGKGKGKGKGMMKCPTHIVALHVCPSEVVTSILEKGFNKSTDPKRCRIGGGVYLTNSRTVAESYKTHQEEKAQTEAKNNGGEPTKYTILECVIKTEKKMWDAGKNDLFTADWPFKGTGIACGQHFPAMGMGEDCFSEYVITNDKGFRATVIKVNGKWARMPKNSVMAKTYSMFKGRTDTKLRNLRNGLRCMYFPAKP